MAIPALSLDEVRTMTPEQLTGYFEKYARYFEDSPNKPYAIRIGSKTLLSDDTMDLRQQFDRLVQ
jgi:hypothetical protein